MTLPTFSNIAASATDVDSPATQNLGRAIRDNVAATRFMFFETYSDWFSYTSATSWAQLTIDSTYVIGKSFPGFAVPIPQFADSVGLQRRLVMYLHYFDAGAATEHNLRIRDVGSALTDEHTWTTPVGSTRTAHEFSIDFPASWGGTTRRILVDGKVVGPGSAWLHVYHSIASRVEF